MHEHLFSKVNKLRPTPSGLVADFVPETARTGLTILIYQHLEGHYSSLYKELCFLLRTDVELGGATNENHAYLAIQGMIKKCEWSLFYDACQIAYRLLGSSINFERASKFKQNVATLFSEENLGYHFEGDEIPKIRPEVVQLTINESRTLLKESEFKGGDVHFKKALDALNRRPTPDVENSCKDSIAAIESVARVLTGQPKAVLSDLVKELASNGFISRPLDEIYQKLYAYRGNEPGVGHALVDLSKVTVADAEFVLAMSAASIIYLVNKRKDIEGK